MTYKSIRIASDILEYAENRQIEEYFLVEMGDRWVSGDADQIRDESPEIASVMEELESRYSHSELDSAFQVLLECEE